MTRADRLPSTLADVDLAVAELRLAALDLLDEPELPAAERRLARRALAIANGWIAMRMQEEGL